MYIRSHSLFDPDPIPAKEDGKSSRAARYMRENGNTRYGEYTGGERTKDC